MRLLHISDFHARASLRFDQGKLAQAMIEDAKTMADTVPFDIVVMSGDLAYAGQPEEFALGQELLLAPLMEALSIPAERVVLAPGNHDVARDLVEIYNESGLMSLLQDRDAVIELFAHEADLERARHRLSAWDTFHAGFYGEHAPERVAGLAHVHRIQTSSGVAAIAALDSAWRCSSDADLRRLILGEPQLSAALPKLEGADFRLAVMHHPLEWLAPFDESTSRRLLEGQDLVLLTGHEHRTEPSAEVRRRGRAIHSRVGALYETHEYYNSYTVIDFEPTEQTTTLHLRTWWPDRGVFDQATNLAEDGTVRFAWAQRGAGFALQHPPFNVVRDNLAEVALKGAVAPASATLLSPASLEDLLVEPRLLTLPYAEAIAAANLNDEYEVATLDPLETLDRGQCVVVAGAPESGLTSALLWIVDRRYQQSPSHLPVYVSFDRRFTARKIERAIKHASKDAGLPITGDAQRVPLLIAIDDVETKSSRGLERLTAFMKAHPEHLFVLGCREAEAKAVTGTLSASGLAFEQAFLAPFGRQQLRKMIYKVSSTASGDMVDKIFIVIRSQELPRNPFVMTALITVMMSTDFVADPSTFNVSSLLQSFVNLLLGSDDLGDRERLAMDYRRREHLLGSFARKLVEEKKSRIDRLDAEMYFASWFQTKGWGASSSPGGVLDSLIKRRVLVQDEQGVGFRQAALLHLFAAKWTEEDPGFRDRVLASPLANAEILRHMAGLQRNSRATLEAAGALLDKMLRGLDSELRPEMFDDIDKVPGWKDRTQLDQKRLERDLSYASKTMAKRDHAEVDRRYDALYDLLDAEPGSNDLPTEPLDILDEATVLLSDILRSSELVDDLDLKTTLLRSAIDGWSRVTVAYVVKSDGPFSAISNILLEGVESEEERVKLDRFIRMLVAFAMAFQIQSTLGTVHLESVIQTVLEDEEFMSSSSHALFTSLLYAELNGLDAVKWLDQTCEAHQDNPMLVEMIRGWSFMRFKMSQDHNEQTQLEKLLIKIYTADLTGTQTEISRARRRIANDLRAAHLRDAARRGRADNSLPPLDSLDEIEGTAVEKQPHSSPGGDRSDPVDEEPAA